MKYISSTVLLLMLSAHNCFSQHNDSFRISGKIHGVTDGTSVYLLTVKEDDVGNYKGVDTIDVDKVINGRFELSGKVEVPSKFHSIYFDTLRSKLGVLLDNSNITVEGTIMDWSNALIKGSTANDEYKKFKKWGADQKKNKIDAQEYFLKYIQLAAPGSNYTPFLIKNIRDRDKRLKAYIMLDSTSLNSYYGKQLTAFLKQSDSLFTLRNGQDDIKVGNLAPDFTFTTPTGDSLSLMQIAKTGNVTLIDFWASWCGPCIAQMPYVKKLYSLYHDKGLNILGVSLDKDLEKWKEAIANENLSWPHVSDLKGNWNSLAAKLYKIKYIPYTILVDKKGKIIGINLLGDSLQMKIVSQLAK